MAKEEAKQQTIAPKPEASVPARIDLGLEDEAGGGLEDIRPEEIRIPFLRVLDPKSPQVQPPEAGGIPGAVAGSILNTASKEVFDGKKGLIFVPAARDYNYVKYLKRNEDGTGGGFRAVIPPDDGQVKQLLKEQGRFKKLQIDELDADGVTKRMEIVETYYLFGIAAPTPDDYFWSCVSFASTQIKHYLAMLDMARRFRYPVGGKLVPGALWMHQWRFSTAYEKRGAQGWYGWHIGLANRRPDGSADYRDNALPRDNPLRIAAKELHDLIKGGKAKADMGAATAEDARADDELPF